MSKLKKRSIDFSIDLLKSIQAASVENATALLSEARLLLSGRHFARAYFLAVSGLEEVGKAFIAFNGRGRDLSAGNVQNKIFREINDHSAKTLAAFAPTLTSMSPDQLRSEILDYVHIIGDLRRGREASMYVDFTSDSVTLTPQKRVHQRQAMDAISLLDMALGSAVQNSKDEPRLFSSIENKLYTLGAAIHEVWKTQDFGEYLIDYLERRAPFNTQSDFNDAMNRAQVTYHDAYLKKGKTFLSNPPGSE